MISTAVIGGGLSGLNAAYRLTQHNIHVTLFEATSRTGGIIHSETDDGYLVEHGPSSIEGMTPAVAEIIQGLGLEQQRIEAHQLARRLYIVKSGQLHPMPFSPSAFLKSELLSPLAKMRALQEVLIKRGNPDEEENVAQFVRRRLGIEIFNYAVSPFVTGILAGDPEQLSIQHTFPQLYVLEQKYGSLIRGQVNKIKERKRQTSLPRHTFATFSFVRGMQTLTDALYSHIHKNVRLNARVLQLQQDQSGWTVTVQEKDQTFTDHFDTILYTAPLHQLHTIHFESKVDLKLLHDVYYPPLSVLALGFRKEDVRYPLDGASMLFPDVEPFSILGTQFSSTTYPNRAPDGHILLTNYIGGACNPKLALEPTEELLKVTMRDLGTTLGIMSPPTYVRHILLKHSTPQYNLGYNQVQKLIARLEREHLGLFMAGNYQKGISIREVLNASNEAVRRITSAFPFPEGSITHF